MSEEPDWTRGPAKWAAVAVLGGASVFGIGWSILTRAPRASMPAPAEVVALPQEPDAEPAAPARSFTGS